MNLLTRLFKNKFNVCACVAILLIVGINEYKYKSGNQCTTGFATTQNQVIVKSIKAIDRDQLRLTIKDLNGGNSYWVYISKMGNVLPGQIYSFDVVRVKTAGYMKHQGICGLVQMNRASNFRLIAENNNINRYVYTLSQGFKQKLVKRLGEKAGGIIIASLFGDTYLFTDPQKESFRSLGITHLVAVSGANFTLVVGLFDKLLNLFSKFKRLIVTFLLAFIYMLLVGLENLAAFRAFIFFSCYSYQQYLGVRLSKISSFLFSLAIILLIVPDAYINLGLQLSILAWLSVNFLLPSLLISFKRMEVDFWKGEILTSILSTGLLLPISMLFFGQINLISLVANVIFVPIFSFITIASILILLLVCLPTFYLTSTIFTTASKLLILVDSLIKYLSNWQLSIIRGSQEGVLLIVLYVIILFFTCVYRFRYENDPDKILQMVG